MNLGEKFPSARTRWSGHGWKQINRVERTVRLKDARNRLLIHGTERIKVPLLLEKRRLRRHAVERDLVDGG